MIDPALERQVWTRAAERCEYCRVPQLAYLTPFQLDHVIARKHAGQTVLENLALSCFHCNAHKGPNIAGLDPLTRELTRLFHPRQDEWARHFKLHRDGVIDGKTGIGRTTAVVLNMNEPLAVAVRLFLINEGDALAELMEK